jgi:hypothetical protein
MRLPYAVVALISHHERASARSALAPLSQEQKERGARAMMVLPACTTTLKNEKTEWNSTA